ncbi:MAG: radical SAM protein, partial [Deltaproteobacteria bacterium]|nr:radical SAM protein [Deltaproteobacteria bacterium]
MHRNMNTLPYMLYADERGQIFDHPHLRMAGFSGGGPVPLGENDLHPMPAFSKLFYLPNCPPIGLNPDTGNYQVVSEMDFDGVRTRCHAVSAFLEPGWVRSHLPAADYSKKSVILPTWAYTAVGMRSDTFFVAGFEIEYNHKWDPKNYDDAELIPAIQEYENAHPAGPLVRHLKNCAVDHHCFAAKNVFLKRWEAPLPVSRSCNAACLGCLSLQPDDMCPASHNRLAFRPSMKEIVSLAVQHLNTDPEPIVSFGQGCEGEPLTEYRLIADAIREIRKKTNLGTINLNTNASWPDRVRLIAESGLDSIRISMNSARPNLYRAYSRPKGYDFEDVVKSIILSKELGLYTMINYLVFPGITDQEDEIEALRKLINRTGVNFIHFKNLNIDP